MSLPQKATKRYALAVIALISCSMLMYEILLTRICALRLFYHFAFLIISNCLLGIGASGTLISLCQESWRKNQRFWIARFSFFYLASLAVSYAFLIAFPIGWYLSFWRFGDLLRLSIYNLMAAVPFFFGGTVVGMILTFNAEKVNKIYCWDLVGAGLGCLLCPFLLWKYGAGGCLVFLVLLALLGTLTAYFPQRRSVTIIAGIVLGALGLWLLPQLDTRFPVPGKDTLDFTSDRSAFLAKIPDHSAWSTNSRVDLFSAKKHQRFMFGRGQPVADLPTIPDEKIILQDGSAATLIINFSENPECLELIRRSMYSAAMQLKERPRVMIIGVGGGNDVWAAKIHDASSVKGFELNQPVLDIHYEVLPHYSRDLLDDSRIQFIHAEGRSALMRESDHYDIIQMTAIDTWTALASGAYMLAENYLYTREAIEDMYEHLDKDGILFITRVKGVWESLRLVSNINAAFEKMGIPNFENSIICINSNYLIGVLIKKGTFTEEEEQRVAHFVNSAGLELVYSPGRKGDSIIEDFIRTENKNRAIRESEADISPTTDDRPYFFLFIKWNDMFRKVKPKHEGLYPYEFYPLLIASQLILSIILSIVFILLPLVIFSRKGIKRSGIKRFLVYFAGLGLGFILIEITVMQKLTLFLGHPLYSLTVTLFSILIFAGLGSLLSARWFQPPDRKVWLVPLGLAVLLCLFIFVSPHLMKYAGGLSLIARISITVILLAPIGLLLGVPFAYGIRLLNIVNPSIIPWAWAVNACSTVVGAILTVVLSMNLGFTAVLIVAILTYFMAFAAISATD